MSDRFENEHGRHPDWLPERRPWCPECMVPSCGCPTGEALDERHIYRGTD